MAQMTAIDGQGLSSWWRTGRTGGQHLVGHVELLDKAGSPFRSTGPIASRIHVVDCSISTDRSRSVWGQCSATILFPWDADQEMLDLLPTNALAPLAPTSGVTFRVAAGFRNPVEQRDELVWCGRYDIEACEITETADGLLVRLEGIDLTGRLEAAKVAWPVDMPWGWRVIDIAKWLIGNAIPGATFVEDPTDATAARVVLDEQTSFMAEVSKALQSIGFELAADAAGGAFILRRLPTTSDTPQWTFDPGSSSGWITKIGQSQDRQRVYNIVIAKGENPNSTDPPVRAIAWLSDTSDPTYIILGPPTQSNIGPRPYFFTSQYLRTQADADNAAQSELRRIRGLLQRVNIECLVNPAIEAGDVLHVQREDIGIVGRYVVQSRDFDLSGNNMRLTCEERRV